MSPKLTIDERLDKYADFCFAVGTLVLAYGKDEISAELKAKAFDKFIKEWKVFSKEVQSWTS